MTLGTGASRAARVLTGKESLWSKRGSILLLREINCEDVPVSEIMCVACVCPDLSSRKEKLPVFLAHKEFIPSRSVIYRIHFKKCARAFRDHTEVKAQTQYKLSTHRTSIRWQLLAITKELSTGLLYVASFHVHFSCMLVFCHSIHPFRNSLSVKPAVFFSMQSHRSGSRRITEGGCPAPLSHQPLQTQAPPAALPAVDQDLFTSVSTWSPQTHPANMQDSCFPRCFHVHTLPCPNPGTTHFTLN